MPVTPRVYEKQVDGTLLELTLKGELQGYDTSNNPIYGPLQISVIGDPTVILTPAAPTIVAASSSMTSRTASHIVWTAPPDNGGPPVTAYHIYRSTDGGATTEITGSPTSASTFSINETGLPVNTPERIHTYTVRAANADGLGDVSNQLILQWNSGVSQTPVAATLFTRHNLTTAQIDLSWTQVSDPTVDKNGLFQQGVLIVDNIDKAASTFTWSGPTFGTSGTRHTSVGVARHNSFGWGPVSNTITFTVPIQNVVHDPVMGVPTNDEFTAAKLDRYPLMDTTRTYAYGQLVNDVTLTNARVVALTPNGSGENLGNPRSDTNLVGATRSMLETFYYFTDGTPRTGARNPITGTELHVALDNETDRGANPNTTYINNHRDVRAQIYTLDPGGARRYPRASMWIDMTQNNIRTNGSGVSFKPVAQYLDGFGCSMYPPGRKAHSASGTVNDNITFSSYSSFMDAVIVVVSDWMTTGGNAGGPSPITMFGTWEFGTPIDHPFRDSNIDGNSGEPTDLTNFSIRPRFLAGGVDSAGKDWTGYLNYLHDALDGIGCIMREQIYWSQQSDASIPNPLWHDQRGRSWSAVNYPAPYNNQTGSGSTRAEPDSEEAWFNWTIGSRLPNG